MNPASFRVVDSSELLRRVEQFVENELYPRAVETDRSALLPKVNLDGLADLGLYGMFGPHDVGGLQADADLAGSLIERIASGCLTTALVWMQHHRLVGALQFSHNEKAAEMLPELCAGAVRSGVIFAGLLPGPSSLVATPTDDGWTLNGRVPWVSGWGRIDVINVLARTPSNEVISLIVTANEGDGISIERQELLALNASGTVTVHFDGVTATHEQCLFIEPHNPSAALGTTLRLNGSLALGLIRRCALLMESEALWTQMNQLRQDLDRATDATMSDARAAASYAAVQAASANMVATGSASMSMSNQAQRISREAQALLVFGSRAPIKAALLERFHRPAL